MPPFQLSDYLAPTHMAFGLQRMQALMAAMGNPHRELNAIHVAGTNGKGSVTAYLTAVLLAGHYTVGTTTSPHLVTERERIAINGQPVSEAAFTQLCDAWLPLFKQTGATYFEAMTALAFKAFHQGNLDFSLVEVGLGGRLDATNVLESPAVCVITSIGLDHTEYLGHTVAAIATEKAGIGKAGMPMVLGPSITGAALAAIQTVASQVGFPLILASRSITDGLHNPLLGAHQADNLATALTVLQILREQGTLTLTPEAITLGIGATRWPARLESFEDKQLLLDGSHNADGFESLAKALCAHPARTGAWLVSLKATKALEPLLQVIMDCQPTLVIITQGPNQHGGYHSPNMLAQALSSQGYTGDILTEPDPHKAFTQLQNHIRPPLGGGLITGSLHTAGLLRPLLI